MARTKAKPRRRTIELREDIVRGKAHRVDRDKGVIFGVKILGLESVNGRRYSTEAIGKAKTLYEGVGVFVNHPDRPNDPRGVRERFGRLVNVRVEADGLYGDLEYLKSHPDAALITEAAERMPEQFGLSHNAKGEGADDAAGLFVVQEIVDVRSVDVVTEPATTGGMFEHRTMKITIKQLLESAWKKYVKKTTKRPRLAACMKRLVEDDAYDVMDEEPGGEEVPADHEEALKGGFRASVAAIVDKCLDGEEDPKECITKIKELLTAHSKLAEGDDAEEDDMEEEEEPEEKDKKDDKKETEEQRELRVLKAKDKARELCEEAGVACDKVLLEALTHLADDKAMKRLIEREKGKAPGKSGNAPRSGATGGGKSGIQTTLEGVDTPEGCLAALLG